MCDSFVGADVTVPLSTGEWLLSFWKLHLEQRASADPTRRPLEIIAQPGDLVFVPHGYWHMVVNLDDCIAITQNYVSTSNLVDCLRFLREKTDQISGIRDRPGEAVQPEEVYELFVARLAEVLPAEQLETVVQSSFLPSTLENASVNQDNAGRLKRKNLIHNKRAKVKTPRQADTSTSSTSQMFNFGFQL